MKTFYSHLDETPHRGGTAYLFRNTYGLEQVHNPAKADIIIWNGGEDIATSIYNEDPISRNIPKSLSKRDREEIDMFNEFSYGSTKLLLGICRGAQLLNVLNGGSLWQDVNGHHTSHPMMDLRTGETIQVTSTHHQQFRPGVLGQLIGVSSQSTAKAAMGELKHFIKVPDLKHGQDAEIVWYPHTRSLCIQGHPEYVPGSRFSDYTLDLIKEFYQKSQKVAA